MYRRRALLRAGVTATALAVAGCTGRDGSTASDDGGDEDDTESDDAGTETPDESTATDTETDDPTGTATDDGGQTTQRVQVVSRVGNVSDGAISAVELIVAPAPGSGRIDLAEATIQWIDANGVYTLLASSADATAAADGTFRITPIKDGDGSAPVLNDAADRLRLSMDLGATDEVSGVEGFGAPLEPGESATLQFTTQSGATTTIRLTVPDTLAGREAVVL
ncbi:MAG: hypothetical protein ABEJ94_02760 [Halorientalis sp.]